MFHDLHESFTRHIVSIKTNGSCSRMFYPLCFQNITVYEHNIKVFSQSACEKKRNTPCYLCINNFYIILFHYLPCTSVTVRTDGLVFISFPSKLFILLAFYLSVPLCRLQTPNAVVCTWKCVFEGTGLQLTAWVTEQSVILLLSAMCFGFILYLYRNTGLPAFSLSSDLKQSSTNEWQSGFSTQKAPNLLKTTYHGIAIT